MKKRNKILISCFLVVVLLSVSVLGSFAEDIYRDPEEVEPGIIDKVKDPSVNKIKTASAFKSPSRSVSSDFDENGVNSSFTDGETYNVSDCPQVCSFQVNSFSGAMITVSIFNDTDLTFRVGLRSSHFPGVKYQLLPNSTYFDIRETESFIDFDPGITLTFSFIPGYVSSISVYLGFDPDPQPPVDPFLSILTSVSDFSTSMFFSWTSIVSLIVSSWIFLVPLTMMLVVFFVLAIRKMIKGV